MKMERDMVMEYLSQQVEGDRQFAYECRIQEIEWDVARGLKQYRVALDLSQEEVARRSGLTRQMVSRVETFSYTPNLTTLIKYLWALNIDFSAIINNLSDFQTRR